MDKVEKEIGNPLDVDLDEKWEHEVLLEVNESDKFLEYLKATMGKDVLRYFEAASDEMRAQIKGHFSFAKYLHARILRSREAEKKLKKK